MSRCLIRQVPVLMVTSLSWYFLHAASRRELRLLGGGSARCEMYSEQSRVHGLEGDSGIYCEEHLASLSPPTAQD